MCVHVSVCLCVSQQACGNMLDNLGCLVLSFHHVSPGVGIQVISLITITNCNKLLV